MLSFQPLSADEVRLLRAALDANATSEAVVRMSHRDTTAEAIRVPSPAGAPAGYRSAWSRIVGRLAVFFGMEDRWLDVALPSDSLRAGPTDAEVVDQIASIPCHY